MGVGLKAPLCYSSFQKFDYQPGNIYLDPQHGTFQLARNFGNTGFRKCGAPAQSGVLTSGWVHPRRIHQTTVRVTLDKQGFLSKPVSFSDNRELRQWFSSSTVRVPEDGTSDNAPPCTLSGPSPSDSQVRELRGAEVELTAQFHPRVKQNPPSFFVLPSFPFPCASSPPFSLPSSLPFS